MEDEYGKSTLEDMINAQVVEELAKRINSQFQTANWAGISFNQSGE